MNQTMVEKLITLMMIAIMKKILGEANSLEAGRCTKAIICHNMVAVAKLAVFNTGIMMMESFTMEMWTNISVRVLIPNSQTGVQDKELCMP